MWSFLSAAWFAWRVRSQVVGIAGSCRVAFVVIVSRRGARDDTGPSARAAGDVHDSDADAVNALYEKKTVTVDARGSHDWAQYVSAYFFLIALIVTISIIIIIQSIINQIL